MLKNIEGRLRNRAIVIVVVLEIVVLVDKADRSTEAEVPTLGTVCLVIAVCILLSSTGLVLDMTLLTTTRLGPHLPKTAMYLQLMHWVILWITVTVVLLLLLVPVNRVWVVLARATLVVLGIMALLVTSALRTVGAE